MSRNLQERYGVLVGCDVLHLLEAEGAKPPKPPTEVDRLRTSQEKEKIELKRRQDMQMLTAQERQLERDAREKAVAAQKPKQ